VAEQCGFNHLGLFNTCFKRRFGTSPSQWRKSSTQSGAASTTKPKKNGPGDTLQAADLRPQEAMTIFAGKIPDGADILEDLKRRDLLFVVP
jgi:hypothetical protein